MVMVSPGVRLESVIDMEGLPANAGINIVTNYINGLKNVISSHKSGEMAFF